MQEDLTHELDSGTESRVWNGCLAIITIFFVRHASYTLSQNHGLQALCTNNILEYPIYTQGCRRGARGGEATLRQKFILNNYIAVHCILREEYQNICIYALSNFPALVYTPDTDT